MKKKFICTVCGYVHEGNEAPEKCPLCGAPKSKFKEMDETEITLRPRYLESNLRQHLSVTGNPYYIPFMTMH